MKVIAEMEEALTALDGAVLVHEALRETVELDKAPVGAAGLRDLRLGLDRLAKAWGLVR